jgi:hypothetical protein
MTEQMSIFVDKVEFEYVKSVIGSGYEVKVADLALPNGFVIVQSSSCVDPANYDHELGTKICLERVEDKVWELEGYLLQSKTAN